MFFGFGPVLTEAWYFFNFLKHHHYLVKTKTDTTHTEAQALFVSYFQSFHRHLILFSDHASPFPLLLPSTLWVHVYLNVLAFSVLPPFSPILIFQASMIVISSQETFAQCLQFSWISFSNVQAQELFPRSHSVCNLNDTIAAPHV